LPGHEFTGAKPVTGKIALVQCSNFVSGDFEKMIAIILWYPVFG
jgi:hypothetical protein